MTTGEHGRASAAPTKWSPPVLVATWVALAAFVLAGRGVWSSWWALPRMPALSLESRPGAHHVGFVWSYSGAGAILHGPGNWDSKPGSRAWATQLAIITGLTAACSAGAFLRIGLNAARGGSGGFGIVFLVSGAAFFWAVRTATASTGNPGNRPRRPTKA